MIVFNKKIFLQVTFFASTLFVVSCRSIQKPEDAKIVAEQQSKAEIDLILQEKDAQFLVRAAEIHLKEIQLGQLAQEKSNNRNTRVIGRVIEDAHANSYNSLTALAQSKKVAIPNAPTEKAQDACNALNEKTGEDFDKAFVDVMVIAHKDAIEIFEKASTASKDKEIKDWVIATLPDLRLHLNQSIASQKNF